MKVLLRQQDLSDEYLRFAQQIGADGIDIHYAEVLPGNVEQGYPDLNGLTALVERVRGHGLRLYRVTPATPVRYLNGEAGGDEEVDNLVKTIEIFAQVGIPFMSMPIHQDNPGYRGAYQQRHRGDYEMYAFSLDRMGPGLAEKPLENPYTADEHWERCVELYKRLVPVAERCDVRLITHPSDPPLPQTDVSPRRWIGFMEAVPSSHNGLLYCVGTRYETGTDIYEDIRNLGRKGLIHHVHIRNVRGQLPTTGGYEEIALNDGDMNLLKVLRALREIGYDGCLQVDHLPNYSSDEPPCMIASAYAVGYVKALVTALDA